MKKYLLILIGIVAFSLDVAADCYLTLNNETSISKTAMEQIAVIELSRYIEPVSETTAKETPVSSCTYRLTLTEIETGLLLVVKGPQLTAYAESNIKGLQGFRQALYKTIIKGKPSRKSELCQKQQKILEEECHNTASTVNQQNSEFIVFDATTRLNWQKKEGGKMDWKSAIDYCKNLDLGGIQDWRLPNRKELETVFLIKNNFPNLMENYWSSTPNNEDRYYAWAFSISEENSFSDWIENHYYARCVQGEPLLVSESIAGTVESAPVSSESENQAPASNTNDKDPVGMRWVVGPTLISGYGSIVEVYIHNTEEQGTDVADDSAGYPFGVSFRPYYQDKSGLRYGAGFGPLMGVFIETGSKSYSFVALPVDADLGYTFQSGIFLKGGISYPLASGDFIKSQSLGITGAAGMEFKRSNRVSMGFEVGFDSSSVKLKKYDCSNSSNPSDFSTCESESVTVYPVGLMASFLVIF